MYLMQKEQGMSQVKTFKRHFNDNVLLKVPWYGQEAGGPRHVVVPWSPGLIPSQHTRVCDTG